MDEKDKLIESKDETIRLLSDLVITYHNALLKYKNKEQEARGERYPDGCYLDGSYD